MAGAGAFLGVLPAEEELLVRTRLLTQVASSRGDPPLKKLARRYVALVAAVQGAGPADADEKALQALLKEVAVYEFQAGRVDTAAAALHREQAAYAQQATTLARSTEAAVRDISSLRAELESARAERQHQEECEALRRLIAERPKRAATQAAIAEQEAALAALEAQAAAAGSELDLRKKQFALLLAAVDDLQAALDGDSDPHARPAAGTRRPAEAGAAVGEMEEGETIDGARPMET